MDWSKGTDFNSSQGTSRNLLFFKFFLISKSHIFHFPCQLLLRETTTSVFKHKTHAKFHAKSVTTTK